RYWGQTVEHSMSQSGVGGSGVGTEVPTDGPGASSVAPMGRAVGSGMVWTVILTVVSRAASFGAQWVLGLVLLDSDVGIFAIATAVAMVAQTLRDGGARFLLVQRPKEYDRLVGPVFWLALTLNTLCGVLILGAAPLAAAAYHQPRVAWLLVV